MDGNIASTNTNEGGNIEGVITQSVTTSDLNRLPNNSTAAKPVDNTPASAVITNTTASSTLTSDTTYSTSIATESHNTGDKSSTKVIDTTTTASPISKVIPTSAGGKRKQKLLWRDENAPKPPLSAYLQFLSKTRETVRSQNPGMAVSDVTKVMGAMWREMPLDKKQVNFFYNY